MQEEPRYFGQSAGDPRMASGPVAGPDIVTTAPTARPRLGATVAAALGGGLVAAALTTGAFVWRYGLPADDSAATRGAMTEPRATTTIEISDEAVGFAEAVAIKVTPSVVSIGVQQTAFDPFTRRTVTQTVGNGSGVIIRSDGYILTNDHVIAGADGITVNIGVEELPATVVGRDPSSDLAVIRVERTGLPEMEIGSSAELVVGQPVVAIGSPFGLAQSVTTGIVSALGRTSFAESAGSRLTAYTSLIQTDAAINPGNSGGALTDARGRLIGINTLIQTGSEYVAQSAGVGFAIPVDYASAIADELIRTGRASHPYMGVSTLTMSPVIAARYGLPVEAGAIVESVAAGSPAEAAGVERGDIIVEIAGIPVRSVEDVFAAIRGQSIGDTVRVRLYRGDVERALDLTLGSDTDRR